MKKTSDQAAPRGERLQKILSRAGLCSRRQAEEMIRQGLVAVNGEVVRELGTRADPRQDEIRVEGRLISTSLEEPQYIALHKPVGVLSAAKDGTGRPLVVDLVQEIPERLYPVGRLDYNSEGLILLTNDGEFANLMTHPRYQIPRLYRIKLKGIPERATVAQALEGVRCEGERLKVLRLELCEQLGKNSWWDAELHEGKRQHLRRLFEALGHPVLRLIRVRFGAVSLGDLPPGKWRHLRASEVRALKSMAGAAPPGQRRLVRPAGKKS